MRKSRDEDTTSAHKRERKEEEEEEQEEREEQARRSSVSRLCINPMIDRTVMYVPVTSISRAKIVPTIETLENIFETMEDSLAAKV